LSHAEYDYCSTPEQCVAWPARAHGADSNGCGNPYAIGCSTSLASPKTIIANVSGQTLRGGVPKLKRLVGILGGLGSITEERRNEAADIIRLSLMWQ
jgi:hypothetical protein